MQDTVAHMINYAVSSFPKQSLDEWILDFPQQVILTTVHLILTHEINELFEDMRKDEASEGREEGHPSDEEEEEEDEEEAATPNTRDVVKQSQTVIKGDASSERFEENREGPPGSIDQSKSPLGNGGPKKEDKRESLRKIQDMLEEEKESVQEKKSDGELTPDPKVEKNKFVANMFGADFDMTLLWSAAQSYLEDESPEQLKEKAMKVLQEKSFRGLFLRLQFWIN